MAIEDSGRVGTSSLPQEAPKAQEPKPTEAPAKPAEGGTAEQPLTPEAAKIQADSLIYEANQAVINVLEGDTAKTEGEEGAKRVEKAFTEGKEAVKKEGEQSQENRFQTKYELATSDPSLRSRSGLVLIQAGLKQPLNLNSQTNQATQTSPQGTEVPKEAEDPSLKQPLLKLASQASPGLVKENADAPWKQVKFTYSSGVKAYVTNDRNGKVLNLVIPQSKGNKGEAQAKGEKNPLSPEGETHTEKGEGPKPQQLTQGAIAHKKKEGLKDKQDADEQLEEVGEEKGSGETQDSSTTALKGAIGAQVLGIKSRGGKNKEGDTGVEDPWSIGTAITDHTVNFSGDPGQSAEIASKRLLLGSVTSGEVGHLKVKGVAIDYSGRSHHGQLIPSGDQSLELGARAVVTGSERDIGHLFKTVSVNGEIFKTHSPSEMERLKVLMDKLKKEDPTQWKDVNDGVNNAIKDIKDSIRFRTCEALPDSRA
jgi:hypothetical protein